jgi:hypothetical protein
LLDSVLEAIDEDAERPLLGATRPTRSKKKRQ